NADADDLAPRGDVPRRVGPRRPALEQPRRALAVQVVDDERQAGAEDEPRHRRPHVAQPDESHAHRVSPQCSPAFSGNNPSGRRIISTTRTTPTRIGWAAARRTPVRNGITSLANRLPSSNPSSTAEPSSAPRLLPLPPRMRASHTKRLSWGRNMLGSTYAR